MLRERFAVPIGVNCLRNDVIPALGIAAACGLDTVRVNVHVGAYVTDQGVIEGEAHESLRYRQELQADDVAILADVCVKHARPLAQIAPRELTRDCIDRGLADAIVGTFCKEDENLRKPIDPKRVERLVAAASKRFR